MGRKRTSCNTCAEIKTLCSRDVPCARCKRLALPCSLAAEGDVVPPPRSAAPVGPAQTRARSSRSSTGCVHCRRRRKKCDERWPSCGDCTRLGVDCSLRLAQAWTAEGADDVGKPGPSPQEHATGAEVPPATPGPHRTYAQRLQSPSFDWIVVIDEDYKIESSRVFNLANSSALEVHPESRASDRWPPEDPRLRASTALANLTGVTPAALMGWTTGERHLLNHFLQSVARSIVAVRDEDSPILRMIVPMALENSLVKDAIATLSACHLCKIYPDFQRNLFVHRSRALAGLKTEVEGAGTAVSAIAATLLLCLAEICEGESRKWLLYLHGARALFANAIVGPTDPTLDFLIDLYGYLTSVAYITSSNVPRPLDAQILDASEARRASQPSSSLVHPLFGMAAPLYECLSRMGHLTSLDGNGTREGTTKEELLHEIQEIELAVQSWNPPDIDKPTVDLAESRAAAFAVQWAVILRLRQITSNLSELPAAQMQGSVDHVLSALSLIKTGSQAESQLLLPLFMVGVCSKTKADRLTVEYRINLMKATIGFGNIESVHRVLDETWRRSNRGEVVHWEDIVRGTAPGLLLF